MVWVFGSSITARCGFVSIGLQSTIASVCRGSLIGTGTPRLSNRRVQGKVQLRERKKSSSQRLDLAELSLSVIGQRWSSVEVWLGSSADRKGGLCVGRIEVKWVKLVVVLERK